MSDILTVSDVLALQTILNACAGNKKVVWVRDGLPNFEGVARAVVGDANGSSLLQQGQDVRDGFVWITAMFEHFIPVRTLMEAAKAFMFMEYDY